MQRLSIAIGAARVLRFVSLAARVPGALIHILIAAVALALRAAAAFRFLLTALALFTLPALARRVLSALSALVLIALSLIRVVLICHVVSFGRCGATSRNSKRRTLCCAREQRRFTMVMKWDVEFERLDDPYVRSSRARVAERCHQTNGGARTLSDAARTYGWVTETV
jgi:hypothetical protein